MRNFDYQNGTRVIFGKATEQGVGNEMKKLGGPVLFHYGSGSIRKTGLYDSIVKSLKEAGLVFLELGGVQPNPRLSLVRQGIELCRKNGVRSVLAVGGGSVIDSAKAIAVGTPWSGDVWDFFTGKAEPKQTLPVGVVLTLPAAGSETSISSVITDENGLHKLACNTNVQRPVFAIMNPELTFSLPVWQIGCGAADIMAHVMERYFTREPEVDLTDRLCEATLRTMIHVTPKVLREPACYAHRAEMMWAGSIAHNGLLDTGRQSDWATHRIEHELSALYDVAHGAGLAALFPAWMRHVYKSDLARFTQFAVRVWGVDQSFADPDGTALEGIRRMRDFFVSIGMPGSLQDLSIGPERLDELAGRAVRFGPLGQYVKIHKADALRIFELARETDW
jgi:alcohol dehydrogenase